MAALAGPAFGQTQLVEAGPHRLEIVLERREAGQWRSVDPALVLERDDLLRFQVRANFSGYLYVMNQTTAGRHVLLFPAEDAGRDNRLEAGRQYVIPATAQGSFRVTGPPGHEIVYWLISPVEIAPYTPLPPPPKPGKIAPSLVPRCDDTILRARGDCIDTSAGARSVTDPGRLPENLAGVPAGASRELLFVRQQNASVVAAPAALEGPVIFQFRLAHR